MRGELQSNVKAPSATELRVNYTITLPSTNVLVTLIPLCPWSILCCLFLHKQQTHPLKGETQTP